MEYNEDKTKGQIEYNPDDLDYVTLESVEPLDYELLEVMDLKANESKNKKQKKYDESKYKLAKLEEEVLKLIENYSKVKANKVVENYNTKIDSDNKTITVPYMDSYNSIFTIDEKGYLKKEIEQTVDEFIIMMIRCLYKLIRDNSIENYYSTIEALKSLKQNIINGSIQDLYPTNKTTTITSPKIVDPEEVPEEHKVYPTVEYKVNSTPKK